MFQASPSDQPLLGKNEFRDFKIKYYRHSKNMMPDSLRVQYSCRTPSGDLQVRHTVVVCGVLELCLGTWNVVCSAEFERLLAPPRTPPVPRLTTSHHPIHRLTFPLPCHLLDL